ncbi:hypothetical protein [Geodermatophilus ruber]|uniref:Uncharacterized protein n=1 Tax=Geodermatophilus ruber TaxID=504800 RepID=A0A1I4EKF9_9ACTN|nr:hypothetical protein [Geodermatophilus ruber]SFL05683.1 hypothetical protein SAMN04488085_10654 [Geodermatophilus ruber]
MTPAAGRTGTPLPSGAPRNASRPPSGRDTPAPPAGLARARAVADAVLWEGYLLYPYRRSSGKNRVRWQFGVLAPRPWLEARGSVRATVAGSADAWHQLTECLLEAADEAALDEAWLHVCVRFLQVQHRSVQRAAADGWVTVDALEAGDRRWLTFDEAVAREVAVAARVGDLATGRRVPVEVPGGEEVELLDGGAGRLVRRRCPLRGELLLETSPTPAPGPLRRLRLVLANTTGAAELPPDAPRDEAVRRSLVAAHCLAGVTGGAFVSLLEPPEEAAAAARACRNEHTFPVLAGAPGERDVLLSSPIILYDHPRIAPESPGELFDSGEIDEILSLRTLTLTDEEKREARATDPRAAAILDRVDALPGEVWNRLHGAIRSLRPVPPGGEAEAGTLPWWDPGADAAVSPESDAVVVDGVRVARGSRVRLRPRLRGTDPQDRFLDGRSARVAAVFLDVDGGRHVAVTLEDDPAADLAGASGRYRYFAPEELRPLGHEPGP